MEEISVIGIDLAKNNFQLCGLSASGEVVFTKRLIRKRFISFMNKHSGYAWRIGIEACGGAHHWGRWLSALGFDVKMMSPQAVKPYVAGGHKNDPRDARAIAEATTRTHVAKVHIKSEQSQGLQAVVRVRDRQMRQRVQIVNQLRALMHEFGFVAARGPNVLLKKYHTLAGEGAFSGLPGSVIELFEVLCGEAEQLNRLIAVSHKRLKRLAGKDEICALAMSIPHIGPINGASLAATLGAPQDFANGRAFAAYLGLVPRQHASGDKSRLGSITKHGQKQLRRTLVEAAHTLLMKVEKDAANGSELDGLRQWALQLLTRKHRNVAATAVAARLARIAWAVIAHGCFYIPANVMKEERLAG
jgi:transposase